MEKQTIEWQLFMLLRNELRAHEDKWEIMEWSAVGKKHK